MDVDRGSVVAAIVTCVVVALGSMIGGVLLIWSGGVLAGVGGTVFVLFGALTAGSAAVGFGELEEKE